MWLDLQDRTERLLRDHQAELIELAENLVEHNSLSTRQVVAILGPNKPENPPELLPPPPVRPEPPAVAASATARTAEERSHDLPDETAAR
jgi:hypothetical protein